MSKLWVVALLALCYQFVVIQAGWTVEIEVLMRSLQSALESLSKAPTTQAPSDPSELFNELSLKSLMILEDIVKNILADLDVIIAEKERVQSTENPNSAFDLTALLRNLGGH